MDTTLLITGGTGSFGQAVIKRFLNIDKFNEIRIFSRDEKKQDDLRRKYSNKKLKFYIGDIRDKDSLDAAISNVDFVFHAAALKQVPSCEFFPIEAVKTNVLGTENLLSKAIEKNIKKVVVLSTDKAAYPVNAMGMSKALMEKVAFSKARCLGKTGPIICCTRYGNVMGSRGSAIPLFVNQIKNNQQITVTNPEMTRFMMNLDEAIDLVIYAFDNGKQGDLFVQKSHSVKIKNLVKALKKLFDSSADIKIIGNRHGEKLFETLLTHEEFCKAQDCGNYFKIETDNRDLNYDKYFIDASSELDYERSYHSHNAKLLNINEMITELCKINLIKHELSNKK